MTEIYELIFNPGGLNETLETSDLEPTEIVSKLREQLSIKEEVSDSQIEDAWNGIFRPNPDAIRWLEELSERYLLILASNTNALHFDFVSSSPEFSPILDIFDAQVLSYEIGCRKPDPKFMRACADAARYEPQECLFVDDLKANVKSAKSYGFRTCHYREGKQTFFEALYANDVVLGGIALGPADVENARKIYDQKYLQYRHFDNLIWKVPGWVVALGAVIVGFGKAYGEDHLPWALLFYGVFALISSFYMRRLILHQSRNTRMLQLVGKLIGDYSIPSSTNQLNKLKSASWLFMAFICFLSIISFVAIPILVWWPAFTNVLRNGF